MRALPVLAARSTQQDQSFSVWHNKGRAGHLLAVFRCYQTAAFGNGLLKTDSAAAFAVAAAAAADAADAAHSTGHAFVTDATRAAAHAARAAAAAAFAAHAATDLQSALPFRSSFIKRVGRTILAGERGEPSRSELFAAPLWPTEAPPGWYALWERMQADLRSLDAGFEIWIDWYNARLRGYALDLETEEKWALLSPSRQTQSPAEINAYLKSLLKGEASEPLNRVRAIFLGHGGAGKTSLIRALHGEEVVEGKEQMTPGVAITDSDLDRKAGVFTHEHQLDGSDLTVHFWDFGGQVMAHATHQFFLREQCLYIIVLDARVERNANEEAEYWLEHVRAFGKNAPVLLVGNKADKVSISLDLETLRKKYENVLGFYPLSCTQAKGRFQPEFQRFERDFKERLQEIGTRAELFTKAQFAVLKAVRERALESDFLRESLFERICAEHNLDTEQAGGRDTLLDLFDKLGIVMHFPQLPYFDDYVLNPRWLTYGVYQILYSECAQKAMGRISDHDVVQVLKSLSVKQPDGRTLHYPAERCRLIADAMVAFRVGYRLRDTQQLAIPALLEPQQPRHGFDEYSALAFQFDFGGFLPRNVLPTLIVDHHADIAREKESGDEILWQNGVLLRPDRNYDAEALIRADYHERNLDIHVSGSDANSYLGLLRDGILRTLSTMPDLPFEEKLRLKQGMRVGWKGIHIADDHPVWMPYGIIETTLKNRMPAIPGPDNHMYDLEKIISVMPVAPEIRPADVFISYKSEDRAIADDLEAFLTEQGYSVWFDRYLIGAQQYRDILDERIDKAGSVVAIWTKHSVRSRWVRHEASRASRQEKLICLRASELSRDSIPAPFPANDHILKLDDREGLRQAVERLVRK
jgi:small GTP-binding protein